MKSIFISKNSQVRSGWKIASTWLSFYFGNIIITSIIMIIYMISIIFINRVNPSDVSKYLLSLSTNLK